MGTQKSWKFALHLFLPHWSYIYIVRFCWVGSGFSKSFFEGVHRSRLESFWYAAANSVEIHYSQMESKTWTGTLVFSRHLGIYSEARAWEIGLKKREPGPGHLLKVYHEASLDTSSLHSTCFHWIFQVIVMTYAMVNYGVNVDIPLEMLYIIWIHATEKKESLPWYLFAYYANF